ncbi:MAG: hypothetical protein WAW04_00915 [Paucilactobacillus nenjiangensis]
MSMTKYRADLTALNGDQIGTNAHGYVEFEHVANNLHITLEMFDTPANIQHWEHFHGFPNGQDANVPTLAQDSNHDGWIDLPETEAVSGTTMVPLDGAPHHMHIPNDNYPVANEDGYYSYQKDVPYDQLQAKFKEVFNDQDLQLDKRVVYIHGIPNDFELPVTVGGKLNDKYEQHVTLPIAAGKIKKIED